MDGPPLSSRAAQRLILLLSPSEGTRTTPFPLPFRSIAASENAHCSSEFAVRPLSSSRPERFLQGKGQTRVCRIGYVCLSLVCLPQGRKERIRSRTDLESEKVENVVSVGHLVGTDNAVAENIVGDSRVGRHDGQRQAAIQLRIVAGQPQLVKDRMEAVRPHTRPKREPALMRRI